MTALYTINEDVFFHAIFMSGGIGKTGLTDITVIVYDENGSVKTPSFGGYGIIEIGHGLYRSAFRGGFTAQQSDGTAGKFFAVFATADTTVTAKEVWDVVQVYPTWMKSYFTSFGQMASPASIFAQDLTSYINFPASYPNKAGMLIGKLSKYLDATAATFPAGSVGSALGNLDATVSSRLDTSSYAASPTTSQIAYQVWEESTADHTTPGTTGNKLASGSGSDPLTAILPGIYAPNMAGAALSSLIFNSPHLVPLPGLSTVKLPDQKIRRGDSYQLAEGRALHFVFSNLPQGLDFTGAIINLHVGGDTLVITKAATSVIFNPATSTLSVAIELTKTDTTTPTPNTYDCDVEVTFANGNILTLGAGKFVIEKDVR